MNNMAIFHKMHENEEILLESVSTPPWIRQCSLTNLDFLECVVLLLCESGGAVYNVDEGVDTVWKRQQGFGDLDLHFLQSAIGVEQSWGVDHV